MKSCPNCGELLGDSVKVCFKCRYDFVRQQQKAIEEAKAKEE